MKLKLFLPLLAIFLFSINVYGFTYESNCINIIVENITSSGVVGKGASTLIDCSDSSPMNTGHSNPNIIQINFTDYIYSLQDIGITCELEAEEGCPTNITMQYWDGSAWITFLTKNNINDYVGGTCQGGVNTQIVFQKQNFSFSLDGIYIDKIRIVSVPNPSLTCADDPLSIYKQVFMQNYTNLSNQLPSFNITSNNTNVKIENGVCNWHYDISANDPEGDTIYYSMQKPYLLNVIDRSITFDGNWVTPNEPQWSNAIDDFLFCKLLPFFMVNNLCQTLGQPDITYVPYLDDLFTSLTSTGCSFNSTLITTWRNLNAGVMFNNKYYGHSFYMNGSACSDVYTWFLKSYDSNMVFGLDLGLEDGSDIWLWVDGSRFSALPIKINRTGGTTRLYFDNGTEITNTNENPITLMFYNYLNQSTYNLEIREGTEGGKDLIASYNNIAIPLTNLQGFGVWPRSGMSWIDNMITWKSSYSTNWSTTKPSSPIQENVVGQYNYRFYVTDQYHLLDYSNYKDTGFTCDYSGAGDKPNALNNTIAPWNNPVIKNTPIIVFIAPVWGILDAFGIFSYTNPWFWFIYIISLGILIFIMKNLQVAFMSLNLICFGCGMLGLITETNLIVIVFLLALSLVPYAASLFQVGQEK